MRDPWHAIQSLLGRLCRNSDTPVYKRAGILSLLVPSLSSGRHMFSVVDQALLFTFCLIGFLVIRNRRRPVLPYPPGPKRLPLLGNLLDLPKTLEWETYARWSKEYSEAKYFFLSVRLLLCSHCVERTDSDVIYLKVAGTDIIVVNSQSAANEVFEKKSSIYSSRFVLFNLLSKHS